MREPDLVSAKRLEPLTAMTEGVANPTRDSADPRRGSHAPLRLHARPAQAAPALLAAAALDIDGVYALLESRREGLSAEEARARLDRCGPNVLARDRRPAFPRLLGRVLANPLVGLLAVLAVISLLTHDPTSAAVMTSMIALSVGLRLVQEVRATSAAERLRALISIRASVRRGGALVELPTAELVPGDVIELAAGDMVPADVRLLDAKDLFLVQSALTGETFPVEKFAVERQGGSGSPLELASVAFLGTSVASGSAAAIVAATGKATYFGAMAASLQAPAPPTAFDRNISRFTLLMLGFMAVMVPLVFLINGLSRGAWGEAFFFAVSVAVGLTPEMLPMIVTICLSKGALAMGAKKVIVKRINAIQDLGAMDILCTDKTGTLTRDEIILERHCDVTLAESEEVLALGYVNSHFQTGLRNLLDRAVLAHQASHDKARVPELTKVDEIPFDFERRIMSVVVRTPQGHDRIIAKGAPEAIFARCGRYRLGGELLPLDGPHVGALKNAYEGLSADGFRVLAIASKDTPCREAVTAHGTPYSKADECDLTLEGYLAFLDPPKETAREAIAALEQHGVAVKVVTGDNELVARKVCSQVGLSADRVLLGDAVERLSDAELAAAAEDTVLFARVSPAHKQRIIIALQSRGHTVGFMGDGINDAPALHAADVGISVDTAVDIAKESADMILLEKSLLVLDDGVLEGRKVFSNIINYVRMGASSNFGNMFSVLGASVFIPFLPMMPLQILANNLLYDVSQTAIPTDAVDPERTARPRRWEFGELTRFILFIGPCSSVFDYVTFAVMLYVFGCSDVSTPLAAAHSQSLFQTGWFVESVLTQTLIIHVIRTNNIPFVQSRASAFLTAMSASIMTIAVALPSTPIGRYLGLTPLPPLYWPLLAATLLGYMLATQALKTVLLRRHWI